MIGLILMGTLQLQSFRDLMYNEKYDKPSYPSTTVYGAIQTVSSSRITIRTIGKVVEQRSYPTHRRLSLGVCSYRAHDPIAYATPDVRAGDFVTLYICQEAKTDYCFALSPHKRPGGLVLESRKPNAFASYAERANAVNSFADTGKPIPRFLFGRTDVEYPFADSNVPREKRLKRFPKNDPFSYMEYLIFMR